MVRMLWERELRMRDSGNRYIPYLPVCLYLGQHLKLEKVDTSMESCCCCCCFREAKHGKVSGCFVG